VNTVTVLIPGVMSIMDSGNPSSVLVTGGRGFVGRTAVKLLQRHGYRLISVDQVPAKGEESAQCRQVACNVCDAEHMEGLFQREHIAAIVHLAAILPTAAAREPSLATRVNIHGSHSLLQMAKQYGVRRFLFGSSLSVYGTCPVDQVISEEDHAAPGDLYGAAKLYVEQLGEAYRRAHGLEFVSLRIGRVVGPGARSATSGWRSEIFERLGAPGEAEITIPYSESERILLVHVEDVAEMLLRLLRSPQIVHGVYNAACESVMVGELRSQVERLNPRVRVKLGGEAVVGNPRRVDWSRFFEEFGFAVVPMLRRLQEISAGNTSAGSIDR